MVNEVSYVPGPSDGGPVVFTVTKIGVGEPATAVTGPEGDTESHGAELAVSTVRMVAALEVTLIT